ncbi:lysylphosphatidylglycerol synthase transmembrane domain-containing protein [Haladaptatus sp. NG-WS-4]
MNRNTVRLLAVVFALGLLVHLFGGRYLRAELATANLGLVAVGFVTVLLALFCWSEAIRRLLDGTATPVRGWRFRGAYLSSFFAKQVIPIGRASSPFLIAYIVSSETEAEYDRTLAVAFVVEVLNAIASLGLLFVGLLTLVVRGYSVTTLVSFPTVETVAFLAGIVLVTSLTVYRYGTILWGAVLSFVSHVVVLADTLFGGRTRRLKLTFSPVRTRIRLLRNTVRAQFDSYSNEVSVVLDHRRDVAFALLFSLFGWLCFCLPFYVSFLALGRRISLLVAFFIVPASGLARMIPVPGGLGGVEVVLVAMSIALVGMDAQLAGAGVLLYRLVTYWFVLAVGGIYSVVVLDIRQLLSPRRDTA